MNNFKQEMGIWLCKIDNNNKCNNNNQNLNDSFNCFFLKIFHFSKLYLIKRIILYYNHNNVNL